MTLLSHEVATKWPRSGHEVATKWRGEVIVNTEDVAVIHNKADNYIITKTEDSREVKIFNKSVLVSSFKDEYVKGYIIRYLDSHIYIIKNNKIIFKVLKRKVQHIKPIKPRPTPLWGRDRI